MVAVVDHADEQEQPAGRQAVVDHLQHAAGDARRVQREQAQHAEAQVGHAAVGDQLLDVALRQRTERAVNDAADRERSQQRHADRQAGVGKQRQAQPQKAVGAELQQHAGQQHAAGRRRFDVRQRQPGVQRKHRHLDHEPGRERQEQRDLQSAGRADWPRSQAARSGIENGVASPPPTPCSTSATSPTSVTRLPASVYRKNLTAAYRRCGPPQMPIMKNSGISVNSKNT